MRATTLTKIRANRNNAEKSTGPTSDAGKAQSARNGLKHGIFAKELFLSDEEKPEFEELNNALRSQFKPATAMQEIGFGLVVCACWRCRLATRLEMNRIKKYSDLDLAEGRTAESTPKTRMPSRWYGSSRSELRAARRCFAELRDEVEANGFHRYEEWKSRLITACGNQDFYDSLLRLKTEAKTDEILMFEALLAKDRRYGMGLPPDFQPNSERARVIAQSRLKWQMAVQLIDDRIQHLDDLARMNVIPGENSAEGRDGNSLDGITRYLTTTTRELERAVRWFQELVDGGL